VPVRFCAFVFRVDIMKTCPHMKMIKNDYSKLAAEAAGTSIAIYLVRMASGENRNGKLRKGSPWPLRSIQSAE